jgi:hypothetical protein
VLSRSISAPVTPFPKFRLLGDLRQQFDGDVHISQPLGFREHAAEKNGAFAPGTAAEVFPLSLGKLVLLRRRWQRLRHGM